MPRQNPKLWWQVVRENYILSETDFALQNKPIFRPWAESGACTYVLRSIGIAEGQEHSVLHMYIHPTYVSCMVFTG